MVISIFTARIFGQDQGAPLLRTGRGSGLRRGRYASCGHIGGLSCDCVHLNLNHIPTRRLTIVLKSGLLVIKQWLGIIIVTPSGCKTVNHIEVIVSQSQ